MTHLPFILAAYGLTIAVVVWLSIGALLRNRAARAKLAVIDPRFGTNAETKGVR